MSEFKEGDWCIYDLDIVQLLAMHPYVECSNGVIRRGNISRQYLRPLTLRNKVIVEGMDHYYEMLRNMDGSAGFNFPDISFYFAELSRIAIDGDDKVSEGAFKRAVVFVQSARDFQPIIDGVRLFRPSLRARARL